MARILAVANIKGGVGKTTTTANLAAALTQRGRHVLAVDLDPQASLTLSFGFQPEQMPKTIGDALDHTATPLAAVAVTTHEGFDLVPANHELNDIARDLEQPRPRMAALRSALEPLRGRYDYVLIDCPANAGILTGLALTAADQVVIPFTLDYLNYQSVKWLLTIVRGVRQALNPGLRIGGIFFTMSLLKTRHAQAVLAALQRDYSSEIPFFSTSVRQSVKLREASSAGKSIFEYAPDSVGAEAYRSLALEIDEGIRPAPANELYNALARAQQAIALQDLRTAYAEFCRATELKPELVQAWIGRAESAAEWDEGARSYARALQIETKPEIQARLVKLVKDKLGSAAAADVPQLVTVGHYMAEAGQVDLARRLFERATELDPTHEQAWLGRARTAETARQAVDLAKRGLELNPQSAQAKAALDQANGRLKEEAAKRVEEGTTLLRSGQKAEAHARYQQAVELDPQNDRGWLGCARTTADYRAAFEHARKAVEINPANEEARELYLYLWDPNAPDASVRKSVAPAAAGDVRDENHYEWDRGGSEPAYRVSWRILVPVVVLLIVIALFVFSRL
ncbi:MAG: AAA family ATPase [Chloroflexi bacterium]|nr:AAA family ATPase [Chloroflexota bacterium]